MKLIFDIPNWISPYEIRYCISWSGVEGWFKAIKHSLLHASLCFLDVGFSFGVACTLEYCDGVMKSYDTEPRTEGFNIFPDFTFRVVGILLFILIKKVF